MKILTVVQRYGENVIGGAESLAREVCRRLSTEHDITILTSCAQDYRNWKNIYPEGEFKEDGVRIIRCPVSRRRNWKRFGYYSQLLFRLQNLIPLPRFLEKHWIRAQGPFCPELTEKLIIEYGRADLVLFFSCLYYPTVSGLPLTADKAVLVPTAHDEPALNFPLYQQLFRLPKLLIFLSPEEKEFVNRKFDVAKIPQEIAGFGVECQEIDDPESGDYFLYLGRIEPGKNCGEMFTFALKSGLKLKAAGPANMPIPPGVDYCGIVTEKKKKSLLSGSKAVIIPSHNESLSIVALESWAYGKPVIVSSSSPVLAGQVQRSQGGLVYSSFKEFVQAAEQADPEMGRRGREYVQQNYSWDAVMKQWKNILKNAASAPE